MSAPRGASQAVRLWRIKPLHTVVWVFFAGCTAAIPFLAWAGNLVAAWILISFVLVEVAILAVNGWRCPLTGVAARYTDHRRDNFDIFLPEWIARRGMLTRMRIILAVIAGALVATPAAASSERRAVTGTTVIVHGFQLQGTVPDWPFHLAEAIRVRAGGGRIVRYDPASGDLLPCAHPACGPQAQEGETVIVFDWATASNRSGTGFSEAAGEALAAGLLAWSTADPPLASLEHLHLIGHSRGAVVASEAAERLVAAGLPPPEQVTSLDPHDAGGFGLSEAQPEPEGLWDDLDVNDLHPGYACGSPPAEPSGVCAWREVAFHDSFWRDTDGFPCLFDPDGRPIPGAAQLDASGVGAFCHSDVHAWYHFTVDTAAATHPVTGDPPGVGWFDPAGTTCDSGQRTSPLARTVDGYNTSRIGGGAVRCPDDPASKQPVMFDFNLAEGIVNGDLEKEPAGDVVPGWWLHGGGGTATLADDGDRYLRLDAGRSRRHGRFVLPAGATDLRLCHTTEIAGPGDLLTVTLIQDPGSRTVLQLDPTSPAGWQCVTAPILPDERGRPTLLDIALHDDGTSPAARVGVDDVGLVVPTGHLFSDGFESGDLSAWSGVGKRAPR